MTDGSYKTFANGPWLTKPAMVWFWDAYLPDVEARKDVQVSPLNATPEQLKGLPPALVIKCRSQFPVRFSPLPAHGPHQGGQCNPGRSGESEPRRCDRR
jgi:hypothetical protein